MRFASASMYLTIVTLIMSIIFACSQLFLPAMAMALMIFCPLSLYVFDKLYNIPKIQDEIPEIVYTSDAINELDKTISEIEALITNTAEDIAKRRNETPHTIGIDDIIEAKNYLIMISNKIAK